MYMIISPYTIIRLYIRVYIATRRIHMSLYRPLKVPLHHFYEDKGGKGERVRKDGIRKLALTFFCSKRTQLWLNNLNLLTQVSVWTQASPISAFPFYYHLENR